MSSEIKTEMHNRYLIKISPEESKMQNRWSLLVATLAFVFFSFLASLMPSPDDSLIGHISLSLVFGLALGMGVFMAMINHIERRLAFKHGWNGGTPYDMVIEEVRQQQETLH